MSSVPEASPESWSRLADLIAATFGLHFPRNRRSDLKRGILSAARELGFDDADNCLRWLLSQPPAVATLQVLANHLTIGETYFFRDRPALDALATEVLPALIRARRGQRQQLRLWCAACCTGEEAYTLAIMLHRLLPDLADWNISIMATDINSRFLDKARAGIYGEWSFRDAPEWLKPVYFKQHANGRYALLPAIRRLVRFEALNLTDGVAGFQRADLRALDLILCRNALMYFTAAQATRVVGGFWQSLAEGGWLVVAPGEVPRTSEKRFETVGYPGTILFRRKDAAQRPAPIASLAQSAAGSPGNTPPGPYPQPSVVPASPVPTTPQPPASTLALARQARDYANQGRLADALAVCDRWLSQDKLDAVGHYLRAIVLFEQGVLEPAQAALQRAVYLDGDFVMAHFTLGRLAHSGGNGTLAGKHFANAQRLLRRFVPEALLPESDGLTAGRLSEILRVLAAPEDVS